MEHKFPLEVSQEKKELHFQMFRLFRKISSRTNQKVVFRFTSQPEFPEFFGKWKTPRVSLTQRFTVPLDKARILV